MHTTHIKVPGLKPAISFQTHDPADELVSKYIHEHHYWELHESTTILDTLKEGNTFVDIGANIGYYSVIAAEKVGKNGKVFSFEPDPKNFSLLKENAAINHYVNIEVVNAGLSNKHHTSPLYMSVENRGDHRLFTDKEQKQISHVIELIPGDSIFLNSDNQQETIHCIKIDTQGYECHIIDGLRQTIQQNQSHLSIVMEFWPWGLRQNQSNAYELLSILDQFNFDIHILDHINGGIYTSERKALDNWLADVENNPDNQGFINLLLTPSSQVP